MSVDVIPPGLTGDNVRGRGKVILRKGNGAGEG